MAHEILIKNAGGGTGTPTAISEAAFLVLVNAATLVPGQTYRIWDAAVASGAPGNLTTSDDGISGFITTAITDTTFEVGGKWQFYSNIKTRTWVMFTFDDTDTATYSITDLSIGGTNLLAGSWNYTGGNDPVNAASNIGTFISGLETDINANSVTSGWNCAGISTNVTTNSALGIQGWGILYLEANNLGMATNSLLISSDYDGTFFSPYDTGVSGDDSSLVNLDAEYDIYYEVASTHTPRITRAYDPFNDFEASEATTVNCMPWGFAACAAAHEFPYKHSRFHNINPTFHDRDNLFYTFGSRPLVISDTRITDMKLCTLTLTAILDNPGVSASTINKSDFSSSSINFNASGIHNLLITDSSITNSSNISLSSCLLYSSAAGFTMDATIANGLTIENFPVYTLNMPEGIKFSFSTFDEVVIRPGLDSLTSLSDFSSMNLKNSQIYLDSWSLYSVSTVSFDSLVGENFVLEHRGNQTGSTRVLISAEYAYFRNSTLRWKQNEYTVYSSGAVTFNRERIDLRSSSWHNTTLSAQNCTWDNSSTPQDVNYKFYQAAVDQTAVVLSSFKDCVINLDTNNMGTATGIANQAIWNFAGAEWIDTSVDGEGVIFTCEIGQGGGFFLGNKSFNSIYALTDMSLGLSGSSLIDQSIVDIRNSHFKDSTLDTGKIALTTASGLAGIYINNGTQLTGSIIVFTSTGISEVQSAALVMHMDYCNFVDTSFNFVMPSPWLELNEITYEHVETFDSAIYHLYGSVNDPVLPSARKIQTSSINKNRMFTFGTSLHAPPLAPNDWTISNMHVDNYECSIRIIRPSEVYNPGEGTQHYFLDNFTPYGFIPYTTTFGYVMLWTTVDTGVLNFGMENSYPNDVPFLDTPENTFAALLLPPQVSTNLELTPDHEPFYMQNGHEFTGILDLIVRGRIIDGWANISEPVIPPA